MQHYKDLTKTNNNTYKEVTINGSKYISTPEGLCPIKKPTMEQNILLLKRVKLII